jgi:hypothetical protein
VLPPLQAHVARFGRFLAEDAWFGADNGSDPFGRSHSIMPWDRDRRTHVLQDPRYRDAFLSNPQEIHNLTLSINIYCMQKVHTTDVLKGRQAGMYSSVRLLFLFLRQKAIAFLQMCSMKQRSY